MSEKNEPHWMWICLVLDQYGIRHGEAAREIQRQIDVVNGLRMAREIEHTDNLNHSLATALAERDAAILVIKRINGRTQYAEHGENTEDQQALKEIGEWCRKELGR